MLMRQTVIQRHKFTQTLSQINGMEHDFKRVFKNLQESKIINIGENVISTCNTKKY